MAPWVIVGWIVAFVALVPVLAVIRESLALPPDLLPTPDPTGSARPEEIFFGVSTSFANSQGVVLATGVAVAGLIASRHWRDVVFVAIAVIGAAVVVRLAKDLFLIPRPPNSGLYSFLVLDIQNRVVAAIALAIIVGGLLTRWSRVTLGIGLTLLFVLGAEIVVGRVVPVNRDLDSFPSGHAMNAMALSCAIGLIVIRRWPSHLWALGLAGAYALVIGMSRVYLGTHDVAEVLAGWSLAAAWVLTCWLVLRKLEESVWFGLQEERVQRKVDALRDRLPRSIPLPGGGQYRRR